jgi:hypothetical protein
MFSATKLRWKDAYMWYHTFDIFNDDSQPSLVTHIPIEWSSINNARLNAIIQYPYLCVHNKDNRIQVIDLRTFQTVTDWVARDVIGDAVFATRVCVCPVDPRWVSMYFDDGTLLILDCLCKSIAFKKQFVGVPNPAAEPIYGIQMELDMVIVYCERYYGEYPEDGSPRPPDTIEIIRLVDGVWTHLKEASFSLGDDCRLNGGGTPHLTRRLPNNIVLTVPHMWAYGDETDSVYFPILHPSQYL